ncbi:hypothetical protein BSZ35_03320 [Salinibacter sp. 10B]|uniref:tagaturonate epimerase family protein n=1 Tax=Salinibacter sp. 10B TaxID=1923971 RepID=UPI000D2D54F7|nr:tagaturonate epimerase family protein [Salinibacter sp. 10B]PQJ33761.1 hypothetical protein BSZ35_03320 [Salinibacter sp. 10B]
MPTKARNVSFDEGALRRLLLDTEVDPATVYRSSVRTVDGRIYFLVRGDEAKQFVILADEPPEFSYDSAVQREGRTVYLCPLSAENARRLRRRFPWTAPEPIGRTSALGCGDRLGKATPGHIRACRAAGVRPVLAQQSIREMERTGRPPQEVLDDASWAVFQEGYTDGYGADADHLKRTDHIDACLQAGFTMYTIDPSEHVHTAADELGMDALVEQYAALPWDLLDTSPEAALKRYVGEPLLVAGEEDEVEISFDEEALMRAAVKYGKALAHTRKLAEYLAGQYDKHRSGEAYDLEMSVDETDAPTAPHEHYFVASELDRLGVEVTSLAPRFVGDFEKGIDYIGDRAAFEFSFRQHAAIAQAFGGYKLSIHSGSDKFSVYPIIGEYAGEHVHLKTAGTSFLEALRIPARHDPAFFRRIVSLAFDRFADDRKTYHVSTDLSAIPAPDEVADEALEETYLEENNGRQLLHITYGSILSAEKDDRDRFKEHFFDLLDQHEEEHYEVLRRHLLDHVEGVGTMAISEGTSPSITSDSSK